MEVARHALDLAQEGAARNDERTAHVGFYLIDRGLAQLERRAKACWCTVESLRRRSRQFPLFLYLGAILLLTALLTGNLLAEAQGLPSGLLPLLGILAVLGDQSSGGGAGELAGHAADDARSPAADGFFHVAFPRKRARWW